MSLQGSERVAMLLAKAPGEEVVVSKGRMAWPPPSASKPALSLCLLLGISPGRDLGRAWGGEKCCCLLRKMSQQRKGCFGGGRDRENETPKEGLSKEEKRGPSGRGS